MDCILNIGRDKERIMKKILIVNNERDKEDLGWIPIIKKSISTIEDVEFTVIHHSEVSEESLDKIKPDLIYATGRVTYDWTIEEIIEDYSSELEMLRNIEIPTLGVCAGHQLIAIAYGSNFGKMVETGEDEEDIRETGFQKIEVIRDAALLNGLENYFNCYELHRDEVKDLPVEFELLASTEMCKIQAMRHKEKELYGVQFHPEQYNDENLDGRVILANFLRMVDVE